MNLDNKKSSKMHEKIILCAFVQIFNQFLIFIKHFKLKIMIKCDELNVLVFFLILNKGKKNILGYWRNK